MNQSCVFCRDRSGLVVQLTRSAHFITPPQEFDMGLLSLVDVAKISDQDSDEVHFQFMRHLEMDLEEKRCILPVFAKRYLATPSYSVLAAAFKLAKRFSVRSDQSATTLFQRIKGWFQLSDEERSALCRSWMVRCLL